MILKRCLVPIFLLAGLATAVAGEMSFANMQKADALAKVISHAEHCGYAIDDAKLESYYTNSGLDDPEVFSHITNMIGLSGMGDKPSKSECTLARMTGKKIGIIAN